MNCIINSYIFLPSQLLIVNLFTYPVVLASLVLTVLETVVTSTTLGTIGKDSALQSPAVFGPSPASHSLEPARVFPDVISMNICTLHQQLTTRKELYACCYYAQAH